jgi:hypothetical protein
MDRALPEFNTVLHKKWNLQNKRMHRRKVQESCPAVDNTLPVAYKYPIVKSKKEMIIEGKFALLKLISYLTMLTIL